jgi:TolB protein
VRFARALMLAGVALLSLVGCVPKELTAMFEKPKAPAAPPAPGESQPERDPVSPELKPEQGVQINPHQWVENLYSPDTIAARITSAGFYGLSQHTYAEAGGDFNVDLDKAGKWMVFSTTRYSKTPQICLQAVTGKAVTLLTEDNMSDMMPKFSPNGDLIVWCTNRYGNWDIIVQRRDAKPDSKPTQLTNSPDDDIHPCWSPDQALLAFSRFNSMDGLWQIWIMDYQTRTLASVTEGLFPEFCPIVKKKDDKGRPVYTIAYQRNRKRDVPWFSIWTIDVKMSETGTVEAVSAPQEIVANDQWAAITPSWSPDGEYLAFATVRKSPLAQWQARIYKADDIWVIRLDGTDLTQITSHSAPEWEPCWAREDGNPYGRIYFTSLANGHPNVWSARPVVAGMVVQSSPAPSVEKGKDKEAKSDKRE